jgi:putative endonuclease
MPVWVYALRSDTTGRRYVGITAHLQHRVRQHNNGQTRSTRTEVPWRLIYREFCPDYPYAREREKFLKSGQGRAFLDTL